ncbi:MAG: ABC transporter substrate-binding protein [Bacteroidia bacterium]|nr:ABC transporter substrate-binding protein [Bacteroidia bacterium]
MRNHLFLCLFSLMLMLSCGTKHNDGGKSVFRFNLAEGITSLDPAFARSQTNIWACNQLYNGLVQFDKYLKVQPSIAKSWSIDDDAKRYTFTLRQDVFFHPHKLFGEENSRAVVADDFVYSLKRILDPKTVSPGAWIFQNVAKNGSGDYAITAPNDSTLVIELTKPFGPFLGLLSSIYCCVVPPEIVNHYGKDFRVNPIGTGAFKYFLWVEQNALIFHKYENYFEFDGAQRLPYLDAVSISFINDKQATFLEFIKGNLDFINAVDASFKDDLLTRDGRMRAKYHGKFKMESEPFLNTEYLGIQIDSTHEVMQGNPLRIQKIRQAINYGFDRKKMITYLRNSIGTPAEFGFIPPGLPSFDSVEVKGYNYNPEKAKALLAEAGFENGNGLPQIVLSTTPQYLDLCEYILGELDDIGIDIKIEVNQGAALREMVSKQAVSFFRASWIADYPDGENYLSLFYSKNKAPNGPNYTHYDNREFDELYEQSLGEANDSLRLDLYKQMNRMIIEDAPVVLLYYDQILRLFHHNIKGLESNAMNWLTLKKVKKEIK